MELKKAFIILVDVSGYTNFIKYHSNSMLHAEAVISVLLESVIKTSKYPLNVNKIEGDAALFYALSDESRENAKEIFKQVTDFFQVFRQDKTKLIREHRICPCDACQHVQQLKLKAIVHHGNVILKKILHFEELAGKDVILAHKLLKNSIKSMEYIIGTKPFYDLIGEIDGIESEERSETYQDLGRIDFMLYNNVLNRDESN